jgi:hypothetical protein
MGKLLEFILLIDWQLVYIISTPIILIEIFRRKVDIFKRDAKSTYLGLLFLLGLLFVITPFILMIFGKAYFSVYENRNLVNIENIDGYKPILFGLSLIIVSKVFKK